MDKTKFDMSVNLDDVSRIREIDSSDSIIATENYDSQFRDALEIGEAFQLDKAKRNIHEIVILGTGGGSALVGGLLRSYLYGQLNQPVIICQGYNIPAFIDEHSLVFVISHSGNTEEILSMYNQARDRGAYLISITSGGALLAQSKQDNVRCLLVPPDIGHPRRDLGYLFVPALVMLYKLGLIGDKTAELAEVIRLFTVLKEKYKPEVPFKDNLAKQIAFKLEGRIPLIYGSFDFYDAVAWRWKNQFGENSKLMSFYNVIPNLHHDEIAGWDAPPEMLQHFHLIILRDNEVDQEKIKKRKDTTVDILKRRHVGITEVQAEGTCELARMFSLIYLGDFVTLYTPICRGVDPTPVDVINLFKKEMAEWSK